ncbi:MAG: hypothetical protein K1X94_19990 [Sandaracinaceae bacterium]|nr:hypothetical protein [Sandaracinaceae bacterium]
MSIPLAGCCFTPPSVAPIAPPPATAVIPGGGPQLPSTVPAEAVHLSPGFTDPMIYHGLAGGPRDAASTLGAECRGQIAMQPNHRFQLDGSFSTLRFLVRGDVDLTLAVRTPGGQLRCNDDTDGLNPVVEGAFEPGIYEVYVGLYSAGAASPYDLGVTTNPTLMPTTMLSAPSTTTTTPGTPLRSGTLTVESATGGIVDVGDVCTYSEVSIPVDSSGLDVRWNITCGTTIVYGAGNSGYGHSSDPSWPPGTIAYDRSTSSTDTDPSFEWSSTRIQIEDDEGGQLGEFLISFLPPTPTP